MFNTPILTKAQTITIQHNNLLNWLHMGYRDTVDVVILRNYYTADGEVVYNVGDHVTFSSRPKSEAPYGELTQIYPEKGVPNKRSACKHADVGTFALSKKDAIRLIYNIVTINVQRLLSANIDFDQLAIVTVAGKQTNALDVIFQKKGDLIWYRYNHDRNEMYMLQSEISGYVRITSSDSVSVCAAVCDCPEDEVRNVLGIVTNI